MLLRRLFLMLVLCAPLVLTVGCGGSVDDGVADAPDEPEPELTEEEVQGERGYMRSQNR